MSKQSYYSNGKLLITGEYLVMKGALALAVPTTMGQSMTVEATTGKGPAGQALIAWNSYYRDSCWFEASFTLPGLETLAASDPARGAYVRRLLYEAAQLKPAWWQEGASYRIRNILDFSPDWGLGSSSSLISNVAQCFSLDPYALFSRMHRGSAYDIACARASGPLWYRLVLGGPVTQAVSFDPPFHSRLLFIYSGQKQDTEASVSSFLEKISIAPADTARITTISRELPGVKEQKAFNALLDEHETIMSRVLGLPKLKDSRFADFPGSIKSLGAWGGDFFLASGSVDMEEIKAYFRQKGYPVGFSWKELVLGA